MWPILLDMTREESIHNLRNLELEAYSYLVSALRAQGPLSLDKKNLLRDTGNILNITQERHKAEIRRAINDEKLNTIAYHITGRSESLDEWAQEGRRLVPLLPRTAPQTVFGAVADEAAESANQSNKQLPSPSNTERKRHAVSQIQPNMILETTKNSSFRIPDPPKADECKKRKLMSNNENSSLAQHLLAPKLCRIQQLYRQKSKQKMKEFHKIPEQEPMEVVQQHSRIIQPIQQTMGCSTNKTQFINQKVNVLDNVNLQRTEEESEEGSEKNCSSVDIPENVLISSVCPNENHAPSQRHKPIPNVKHNSSIASKFPPSQLAGSSNEVQKSQKICLGKKCNSKPVNSSQKLIVMSNPQTVPTSSILQRTLQIPFVKNVSIKNFEKFKIVTSSTTPTTLHLTNAINSGVNSVKHKLITVKSNSTAKKVIPLSQLQVLNSKGSLKMLPLGGKVVGKTGTPSPLYFVNASHVTKGGSQAGAPCRSQSESDEGPKVMCDESSDVSGSKGSLDNDLENSSKSPELVTETEECGVEDYDKKIEEFHILQNRNHECDRIGTINTEVVQNMDYTILPIHDREREQMESANINLVYDDKVNGIASERIQTNAPVVQKTELTKSKSRVTCEELSNFESSKLSDINELY
ncbi:uncharacterized protein isoform X2 [Leptinotarsa decemlineata]|uniref:uncharacterized protein isoform X2 n=1 Tax=Leptinotarsa decemlineata TaxID=7539 RepID=UPI003D306BE1